MDAPQYPAGPFELGEFTPANREKWTATLAVTPQHLAEAVAGLTESQLDTVYKNWTIRQIIHHFSDSHLNAYVRFKLTLTEDHPTIKPYLEDRWVALPDERTGPVSLPLALLTALHKSWIQLLQTMTTEQFARTYFHPESAKTVSLADALCSYAWHCEHHLAQILWLKQNRILG